MKKENYRLNSENSNLLVKLTIRTSYTDKMIKR
jgi:hypothetical protein